MLAGRGICVYICLDQVYIYVACFVNTHQCYKAMSYIRQLVVICYLDVTKCKHSESKPRDFLSPETAEILSANFNSF